MKEIKLPIDSARIELVIYVSIMIKLSVQSKGKRLITTCSHKCLIVLFCRNTLNSLLANLSLISKVHLLITIEAIYSLFEMINNIINRKD